MSEDFVIRCQSLQKHYRLGDQWLQVLDRVSVDIPVGQFLAIMGASGSGKSTLLHLMGGLDTPTSGQISVENYPLDRLSSEQRAIFRRKTIGFIFQAFHLVPTLNALENVALPGIFSGLDKFTREKRATHLLRELGMEDRLRHRPNQLSGGQQQRIAIARALFNNPPIIMADEPTGSLDSITGQSVMQMLREFASNHHKTIVVVTHDLGIAQYADRLIQLKDGQIVNEEFIGPQEESKHAA